VYITAEALLLLSFSCNGCTMLQSKRANFLVFVIFKKAYKESI